MSMATGDLLGTPPSPSPPRRLKATVDLRPLSPLAPNHKAEAMPEAKNTILRSKGRRQQVAGNCRYPCWAFSEYAMAHSDFWCGLSGPSVRSQGKMLGFNSDCWGLCCRLDLAVGTCVGVYLGLLGLAFVLILGCWELCWCLTRAVGSCAGA